jgi:hypothetical protein
VTIDVEESLKGSLGRTVQFLVPGGALGRYRSIFVGAPQFVVERVVVFLGWRGPSYPTCSVSDRACFESRRPRIGRARW